MRRVIYVGAAMLVAALLVLPASGLSATGRSAATRTFEAASRTDDGYAPQIAKQRGLTARAVQLKLQGKIPSNAKKIPTDIPGVLLHKRKSPANPTTATAPVAMSSRRDCSASAGAAD